VALAFLLPAALAPAASPAPAPDFSLLNPELRREWSGYAADEKLRIIVQFESPMTARDWAMLESLGFEELWRYSVIHGTGGWLTAEGVAQLSHYERTWWIEKDTLNEYALEVSTDTIRAKSNWQRIVIDNDGDPLKDNDVELPIDGSGVTIVVADTGIDATHPDLDYLEKVIENKKADVDGQPWVELPNTDNVFGHGTHCAGIAAGSGEASAGLRRGVAPGASLIGLGIGDPWETNEVGAFDWIYEHAAPPNPYNIRVMTNSWGYESVDENWKDAVIQASQRMTYERNVVVTFAASNDGGDGSESRTNIYGNSPGMISVAASYREGGGIAGFSSRGDRTDNSTWPDIAAPGVEIWAARDTTGFIVNAVAGDTNPYYTAISGTSMATPHVAGVAALLWQAAPSLRFSNTVDDRPTYDDAYLNDEWSRIHDLELILKLTSDFINSTGDNGVPAENEVGVVGRDHDFAQGYGQVNVEKAVALALTLEELRSLNPGATVWDALPFYQNIITGGLATRKVNGIHQHVQMFQEKSLRSPSSWFGEYVGNELLAWSQEHSVFVPDQAQMLVMDLYYDQMDFLHGQMGEIDVFVSDGTSQPVRITLPDIVSPDGHKRVELPTALPPLEALRRDTYWVFSVAGYSTRLEYIAEISFVLDSDTIILLDPTLRPEQVHTDTPDLGTKHTVSVATKYYDLRYLDSPPASDHHTLTVESPDEATIAVYRAGVNDIAVAVGNTTLVAELPEDWYFAQATAPGYWPSTSADFYLGGTMTVNLPPLVERDMDAPFGTFVQPGSGEKVEGVVKVRLQLNDVIGLSSVTVNQDGALVHSQELQGATDTEITFDWDTTRLDDGDVTLKAMIIDSDGNDKTISITVEVDNEGDRPLWPIFLVLGVAIVVAAFFYWKSRQPASPGRSRGRTTGGKVLEAEVADPKPGESEPLEAESMDDPKGEHGN